MTVEHSCPLWVLGPRTAHPKFGGSTPINGYDMVEDRCDVINDMFPGDLTSGHLLHEIATGLGAYAGWNSPNAISQQDLIQVCQNGIAAITAPAFGLPIFTDGALLNTDASIQQMAANLHAEAIMLSRSMLSDGIGKGVTLWWPAFDSMRDYHLLGCSRPTNEGWNMLRDSWVGILRLFDNETLGENDALVHLEWKPSVPGSRDYINSIGRAIRFASEVNELVGRRAMAINNEWAHLLIGGTTVEEGTRLTCEAGLFTGFLHANSAELATMRVNDETGEIIEGTPGDDADWAAGCGEQARVDDQIAALRYLIENFDGELIIEHDIDPAGDDPIEYYRTSRESAEQMYAAAEMLAAQTSSPT